MGEELDGWRNLHDRMTANDESHRKYFESSQAIIEEQAARIASLEAEIERWKDTAKEEAHAMEEQKALYHTSQARLSEAVKVLEPFAKYLDEHPFDLDNKGNMLPDDAQPGWTYLNAGQFRAAKAFIATLGEEK